MESISISVIRTAVQEETEACLKSDSASVSFCMLSGVLKHLKSGICDGTAAWMNGGL